MAGSDRAAERRRGGYDGDPAADRQGQADDLALASALGAKGVDGLLHEATRRVGKPPPTPEVIERMVAVTLAEAPSESTHGTGRAMAKDAGVNHRGVRRIGAGHGLTPHRGRSFKLSNAPKFAEVRDVVGLYVDPPEPALVLSVNEESQIQALDRTQPGWPMKTDHCAMMTHDYKRHGITSVHGAPSPPGIVHLRAAVNCFLDKTNDNSKPFTGPPTLTPSSTSPTRK